MKFLISKQSGFAQIFVLAGMLLVAAVLPVATEFVKQNQENRSKAASSTTSSIYTPICTYTYSIWSNCVNGEQTRNILARNPQICSGNPVLSQSCTVIDCTGYDIGAWSECYSTGIQQRVVKGVPSGCTGGVAKPATERGCVINPEVKKSNGSKCFKDDDCISLQCNAESFCVPNRYDCYSIMVGRVVPAGGYVCDADDTMFTCVNGKLIRQGGACFLGMTLKSNGAKCSNGSECLSGICNAESFCVPKSTDCYSTIIGKVVSSGGTVCANGKEYTCTNGRFNSGVTANCDAGTGTCSSVNCGKCGDQSTCTVAGCNWGVNGTNYCTSATGDATGCFINGKTVTVGKFICDGNTQVECKSNGSERKACNPASCNITTGRCSVLTCSTTKCGDCITSAECITKVGCLWGYNGSSTMYCYPKSAAMPTVTPTLTKEVNRSDSCEVLSNLGNIMCKEDHKTVYSCQSDGDGVDWKFLKRCKDNEICTTGGCLDLLVEDDIATCSSSACAKCDATDCGKGNDCLWGYNGSSSLRCYSESEAIPTPTLTKGLVEVTSIRLSADSGVLYPSYNKKVSATIIPDNASDKSISWSSSNGVVAVIGSTGMVTGKSPGTTIIAATASNGTSASIQITVSAQPVLTSTPTPVCNSSYCGNCSQSNCASAGCLWGYNGSSSLRCYSESEAIPTPTPTPTSIPTLTSTPTPTLKPTPTLTKISTVCSSSACAKCDATDCGKGNDCLWGYNGSSTMYCYPKSAAMPTLTPTLTSTPTPISKKRSTATPTKPKSVDNESIFKFKIAFSGIKPSYTSANGNMYSCLASLKSLNVEMGNVSANVTRLLSGVQPTVVSNEVDSKGNQIFLVTMKVDSIFASLNTFNYIKVKGPFHLKQRMCLDKQKGKLDELMGCDINFFRTDDYIYNFSEYTLLAGDVDQNGIINIVDYSLIKSSAESDSGGIKCGKENDLNMDGIVNGVDMSMIEDLLSLMSGE